MDLHAEPVPFDRCPLCRHRFFPYMRGKVQRRKRTWRLKRRAYCALICYRCKHIVGWESPPGWEGKEK